MCGAGVFFPTIIKERVHRDMKLVSCSEDLNYDDLEQIIISGKGRCTFGDDGSYFILSFNGEIKLKKIELKWKEEPDSVEIINTDWSGTKRYSVIEEGKKQNIESSFIKISVSGNDENILEDIIIYGERNIPDYLYNDEEILFDAYDKRNPLRVYRIPINKSIQVLADEILGDEKETLSEHEKIIKFMEYVQLYKIGQSGTVTEDYLQQLVRNQIGACGDYSSIVAALAATQGIECRLLTLGNYPEGSGHAVIEAKIDEKWAMYDPTYALYYTKTPENTKSPIVLSFKELREGKGKEATRVVGSESHITSEVSYEYMGPEIYELANPAGEVNPLNKLYYPMFVEFQNKMIIEPASFQGGSYIGIADTSNAHIWTISGVKKGEEYRIVVRASGVSGEIQEPFEMYVIAKNAMIQKNEYMVWNGYEDEKWEIELIADSSEIELTFDYSETGERYHYVVLRSIEIEKIE